MNHGFDNAWVKKVDGSNFNPVRIIIQYFNVSSEVLFKT